MNRTTHAADTAVDRLVDANARAAAPVRPQVPAYGPVDAALGFALFYYLVAPGSRRCSGSSLR